MIRHLIPSRVGAFWLENENIVPFECDEAPTNLIHNYLSRINHATRIKNPCVRKGFLDGTGVRGSDEFIEITWDEAINLVSNNLKKYYEKYGSSSIYAESYEWGGVGKISWGRACVQRLINVLGGGVFELGDYSTGAGIVIIPHIFGENVYSRPTDLKEIIKYAKLVVFWGANPLVTSKISHDIPMHEHEKYFYELSKRSDIEIIFIDTHINESAKKLNAKTILINSNTDAAMIIGICHYLYINDLYDKDFINNKVNGFSEFKDYFLGKKDGIIKDLAWASEICGVSYDDLLDFANKLAKNPSKIISGRAIQRQHNGEYNYLALSSLAAMLGYIGKNGLGIEFNLCSGCKGESAKNTKSLKNLNTILGEVKGQNYYIPSSRLNDALLNPNKEIYYDNKLLKYPEIKLLINASGSYFTRQPNVNESIKAWDKAECIITLEPFWTSQAKLSDIVLPVAIEGERYDIEQSSNKEIIFALKPFKNTNYKSDFQICKEIAKKFNKSYEFCKDLDELDLMKIIYNDLSDNYAKENINLPSFDEFFEKSFIKIKGLKELPPFTRFSKLSKMNICINNETAKYDPSDEMKNKFLLHLSTPHSAYRLHSQLDNSIIRDSVSGLEPVLIHSNLAKAKGIKNNDIVRIFNDRGEILCGARISDDVKENTIIVCEGAWWQPLDYTKKSLCINGNVNVLTSSKPSSNLSHSNIGHTCKIDIEKFNDDLIKFKDCYDKATIIDY